MTYIQIYFFIFKDLLSTKSISVAYSTVEQNKQNKAYSEKELTGLSSIRAHQLTFHSSSHSLSSRAFLCLRTRAFTSDCTTLALISTCSAMAWTFSMLSCREKTKNKTHDAFQPMCQKKTLSAYLTVSKCQRGGKMQMSTYPSNSSSSIKYFIWKQKYSVITYMSQEFTC